MVVQSASLVRVAAPRSRALGLANTCSLDRVRVGRAGGSSQSSGLMLANSAVSARIS